MNKKHGNLYLRHLNVNDKTTYFEFISDMFKADGQITPTAAKVQINNSSFEDWLKKLENDSKGIGLAKDRVPSTLFFMFRENLSKIIGAIHIRHELNDYLINYGGHIGYGITPSERRKGYAKEILAMALVFCRDELNLKKVLVTCNKDNIGSAKTILANGGVLEDDIERDNTIMQRYWITL